MRCLMAESCWRGLTGDVDVSSAPLTTPRNGPSPVWIGPIQSLSLGMPRPFCFVKKAKPVDLVTQFIFARPMVRQQFGSETGNPWRCLPMENGRSPAAATTRPICFFCPPDQESPSSWTVTELFTVEPSGSRMEAGFYYLEQNLITAFD